MEVNKFKRKIIGIFIVLLLIAIIPSQSIANVVPTQDDYKLWLRGSILVSKIENNTIYARAIRLHYLQWSPTQGAFGAVTLTNVAFPDDYLLISIGSLSFIIGISRGRLEII